MSGAGSISIHRQGVRTASIIFVNSFGMAPIANTTYFISNPDTQIAWPTTERGQVASPFDGYIVGVCVGQKCTTTSATVRTRLSVRIRKQRRFSSHNSLPSRDALITDRILFSTSQPAKVYDCRIPIKKGELFSPVLFRPTVAGSPNPSTLTIQLTFFLESCDNKRGSKKNTRQDLESTTTFHGYGVRTTPLNLNDSSFYVLHGTSWGSLPAANSYGFNITHRSRLYGHITAVMLSYTFTVAGSGEEVGVEIHIRNRNYPTLTNGNRIIKIGSIKMSDATILQPGLIECNVPISRNEAYSVILRTPAWVTNPTEVTYSAHVLIEGVPSKRKSTFGGKELGFKSFDLTFNSAVNNNFANNSKYFFAHPQFNTAMITVGGSGYNASPYTGYINEISIIILAATSIPSGEPMKLWVRIRNENSGALIYDHLVTDKFIVYSNTITQIIPCKIPIKKGEKVLPYIETPTWSVLPVGLRPQIICHGMGI